MSLGELPPVPNEERLLLHQALQRQSVLAMEGGPVVSRDAWARIDHLLDMLNEVELWEVTENTGGGPMLDAMLYDQDGGA